MIEYRHDLRALDGAALDGFFEGWPTAPPHERQLELLRRSDLVELAFDADRLVGFATAITDGVLAAYVPLLEVLREYRGRGIGSELVRRLVARLDRLYMVDLVCDDDLVPFYERLGFRRVTGMAIRRPDALA